MMDKGNIVSFEEYRKQKAGIRYQEDALSAVFKKDLREQTDLLDWYLFHRIINKFKLFVHCLFYENHIPKRANPNSGFVVVFKEDQIEKHKAFLIEAIEWAGRDYVLIEAAGRTYKQLGEILCGYALRTSLDAHEVLREFLIDSGKVLIIKELSKAKISGRKADYARDLIKILDDAHFKDIYPKSDLIFIDYAEFLQKGWSSIGLYLDILM